MNENDSQNSEFWSARQAKSTLSSSEGTMDNDRKEIIRTAIELDIIDIRSYRGYKGDMLIEITTMSPDVVRAIKSTAETLHFEIVIQKDIISLYKIFCISPAMNTYELKEEFISF